MKDHRFFISSFVILLSAIPAVSASAQDGKESSGFEQPPVVKAPNVLPPALISGPHYKVAGPVRSNGYLNIYDLHTDYADYEVNGTFELKQRIRETAAMAELQKFTDSKVFRDAAKKAGVDIVTAPIRAVETVADAVTDPGGTAKRLQKIPAGLTSFFEDISDQVSSGAKAVTGAFKDDSKGSSEKLADTAVKEAADYSGYSEKSAEWYKKLGVDPYTTNKPLRGKVNRIISIQTVVNVGTWFVPGIPGIPGVGEATRYLNMADKLALYESPRKLNGKNTAALQAMGVTKAAIERFLGKTAFTPVMQTLIVDALKKMPNAGGKSELLIEVSEANTRTAAELFTRAICHLGKLESTTVDFVQLYTARDLPAGRMKSGELVVAVPADRLYWTKQVATVMSGYKDAVAKEVDINSVIFEVAGTVSSVTLGKLKSQGIVVKQNVDM